MTATVSGRTRSRDRRVARTRRHRRVRKRVIGQPERPRLVVYRSARHIYVQIVDDTAGRTLASASTLDAGLRENAQGKKSERAKAVGTLIAQRAKDAGIARVAFDRGGNAYHGRIAALADAAREGGLEF